MSITTVLPSTLWSQLSRSALGESAARLLWLQTASQATPPAALVLQQSLTHHIISSGLYTKTLGFLRESHSEEDAVLQTRLAIANMPLPSSLQKELWQWLAQYHASLITITALNTVTKNEVTHPHVNGEANLIESILQTWSSTITQETLTQLQKTLNPAVLGVQWLLKVIPQPLLSSGWLWTSHPWKDSSDWFVTGSWGDTPELLAHPQPSENTWHTVIEKAWPTMDQWWIDRRTKEVLFHHKGSPQSIYFPVADGWKTAVPSRQHITKLCLTPDQLQDLITLSWKIKLKTPNHIALRWIATEKTVYVVDWLVSHNKEKKNHNNHLRTATPESNSKSALQQKLTGLVVQQGHVMGQIYALPDKKTTPTSHTKGKIIFATKLTPNQTNHITHAKGIVTELPVTHPSVLAQIKRYGIPTISRVKHFKKSLAKLKKMPTITVDGKQMGKNGFVII